MCALRYQTLYQVGVLVSRSSLCCVKIRKLWALSLLQVRILRLQRQDFSGVKCEAVWITFSFNEPDIFLILNMFTKCKLARFFSGYSFVFRIW